jgi:hypothetical protein
MSLADLDKGSSFTIHWLYIIVNCYVYTSCLGLAKRSKNVSRLPVFPAINQLSASPK